jgi:hypothetical protein
MTTKPRLRINVDEKKEFIEAKIRGKRTWIEMSLEAKTPEFVWFENRQWARTGTRRLQTLWQIHRNDKRTVSQVAYLRNRRGPRPKQIYQERWFEMDSLNGLKRADRIKFVVEDRIRWGLLRRLRQKQYLMSRIVLHRKGMLDKDLAEHILSFVFKKRDLQLMIHLPWPLKRMVTFPSGNTEMETSSLSPVPVPIVAVADGEGSKAEKQHDDDKKPHEMVDVIDYKGEVNPDERAVSTIGHQLRRVGAKVDGCGGRIDLPWMVAEAVQKIHPSLKFNDELYGFELRPSTFDCTALVQYIENGRNIQRMIQQDLVAETERCAMKIAEKLDGRGELKRFGRFLDRRERKRQRREEMNEELKRDFGSDLESSDEEEDE